MINGNGKGKIILTSAFTVMVGVFILDVLTPLGIAIGALYAVPVLIALPLGLSYVILLASISTLSTIIGYFLSAELSIHWIVLVNRFLSLFVVWASAVLGTQWNNALKNARFLSDNIDARNIQLLDAVEHIRNVKTSNVYKAFPQNVKDELIAAEGIVGNQVALSHVLRQMDEIKEGLLGSADKEAD